MKPKLIGLFLLVGLIPPGIVGWWSSRLATDALMKKSYGQLVAVREIKKSQIENFFAERRGDLNILVENVRVLQNEAFNRLAVVTKNKSDQITRLFQVWQADVLDVSTDPDVVAGIGNLSAGFNALGTNQVRALYAGKEGIENAGDGSDYSTVYARQQGFFAGYIKIHGYEDALLIDPAGNVVYSTHKGDLFGANLTTGPYQTSNLAELYHKLQGAPMGTVSIADVAKLNNDMAMFIGAPIYNGANWIGILVYRIPFGQINTIVQERTGMGKSGETYLVAKQGDKILLCSDRVTLGEGQYVIGYDFTKIAPVYVQHALSGQKGQEVQTNSAGILVMADYAPLNLPDLNWACISRINLEEAITPRIEGDGADFYARYVKEYGYYDLFLIHSSGGTCFIR
jgi:methyl-accepting chemotaxis protein